MDNRLEIFNIIRNLFRKYENNFTITNDIEGRYELWSKKPVEIEGRKTQPVYFGGLIVHGKYVGLYYMPIYMDDDRKKFFKPELLKCLKGKSCFHIKKIDVEIFKQIDEALKQGVEMYKKRGWIE